MSTASKIATKRLTVTEYLAFERTAEERHIYVDGEVFAMAGESGAHADLSVNVVALLHRQLRGSPCRVRKKDNKVRSGPPPVGANATKGMYSYPDIAVTCGEPEYHDDVQDVVLNPKVVIEMVSESTEAFDRGQKFHRYQEWNPTLVAYVLVSQTEHAVDVFRRRPHGWSYERHAGLKDVIDLSEIKAKLKLGDVYEGVTLTETHERKPAKTRKRKP